MRLTALAALAALTACSAPTADAPIELPGDWTVDSDASSLQFDTVKNRDIRETHTLTGISGWADAYGTIRLELDMNTVATGIDIRNERMREHLFETGAHPVAVISAAFDMDSLDGLTVGQARTAPLDFSLSLRGVPLDLTTHVAITRLGEDRVRVESTEPVLVHAIALELMDGIDTLQTLAGLDSIERMVPVSFVVEFER